MNPNEIQELSIYLDESFELKYTLNFGWEWAWNAMLIRCWYEIRNSTVYENRRRTQKLNGLQSVGEEIVEEEWCRRREANTHKREKST